MASFYWCTKRSIAWLRRYSLNIALIITVIFLVVFLSFITWLHLTSPESMAIKKSQDAYFEKFNKEQLDDAFERAWKRLHPKHGYPAAVIYEPGEKPYYVNNKGQRCWFI
jgi:hypothetical protein